MYISIPKTSGKLRPQHKRAALWVSLDPRTDANKFTSEEYYVLFYFSKIAFSAVCPRGKCDKLHKNLKYCHSHLLVHFNFYRRILTSLKDPKVIFGCC